MNRIFAAAGFLLLAACTTTSPRQQFVAGCSSVGEAMIQVIDARRAGKIDQPTFVAIDRLYDAAVTTCDTLPATEDAATIATQKLTVFLAAAGGATGHDYGGGY